MKAELEHSFLPRVRISVDGVFKSWAVTRGPSFYPHDRRLAVEVEDHPLDYSDLRRYIPQGDSERPLEEAISSLSAKAAA